MADLLSIEQIAELKEAFAVFDKDHDGTITVQDLADVFKVMGQTISLAAAAQMVENADLDANGVIDFPEFLTLFAKRLFDTTNTEQDLLETFQHYDLDHTGYITASNLQYVMSKMGCRMTVEEATDMIREADIDGDGRLNFDDFRRIMAVNFGR